MDDVDDRRELAGQRSRPRGPHQLRLRLPQRSQKARFSGIRLRPCPSRRFPRPNNPTISFSSLLTERLRFILPDNFELALLSAELKFVKKANRSEEIDAVVVVQKLRKRFADQAMVEGADKSKGLERGSITPDTYIVFETIPNSGIKSRGSRQDGTGVHDSIVNQRLTKIDSVESLNNRATYWNDQSKGFVG
ncbi:vesicle-fusing ATPase-like isoform X5 [Asparagus officinalis]|uniref:vesicle-fusing ATPase-like isoform X5 n=1 Tax=Asparagus officinalis TaxID=4686 RepID=UPI00098E6B0F|nr:vesicle-fusing ATPase-like isoform X5 [Asparagus officinalis]